MPKADGWMVETIDHLSREELVAKFSAFGKELPIDKIETVDWIWSGEPLDELLGPDRHGTYDYIVASHVIEHIPDLLGFFMSAQRLLKDGGMLSLVVPDKRHCFDIFKPITLTPDLLEAHENRHRRHSMRTAAHWFAYSSQRGGRGDWDSADRGELRLTYTLEQAQSALNTYAREKAPYLDCHAWYFVPSSFLLVMEELRGLDYTRFDVAQTFEPAGCEFYVLLRKAGEADPPRLTHDELENRRLELLQAAMRELSEPFRQEAGLI
jgi:SAM-dependent methyltransferase